MSTNPTLRDDLLAVLWCPDDHGDLRNDGDAATCTRCGRRYPVLDGVLSFLHDADLPDLDAAEMADRDNEAEWYDSIWPEYIDRIELPAHAEKMGDPKGVVMDLGSGPGRITEYLARELGLPTLGLDYSLASLKLLARRCEGLPVLPVHADGRALPIRDGALAGATSGQCYEHFRPDDRRLVLQECARVLAPRAALAVTNLNYNLTFRLWALKGNEGAKEGEHMYGSNFYYVRLTPKEFRAELEEVFDVEELIGIRNFPVRSISVALGRIGGDRLSRAFMRFMNRAGYRADRLLERTPLAKHVGFLLLAKVSRATPLASAPRAVPAGPATA
ncbi:MAG: methyltransferase domain-containing protein [Acidimicrobiia bacterium]